jgi:hypothetical protein
MTGPRSSLFLPLWRLFLDHEQAGTQRNAPSVSCLPTIHDLAWFASVSVFHRVLNSRTVEIFQSDIAGLSYEEQSQHSSGSVDRVSER